MVPIYSISDDAAAKVFEYQKHGLLTPDESLDRLTRLAAHVLKASKVLLVFDDSERYHVKSSFGAEADTSMHDFTYHAALQTKDGMLVGYLCAEALETLTVNEALLSELADMAMDLMEMQLRAKLAYAQQRQLLQIAAHDLKNPLTTIPVRADLIKLKKDDPEMVDRMCDQIKKSGLMMTRTIDELITTASMEDGKLSMLMLRLNFADIVQQLVESNEALAFNKNQRIELSINSRPWVEADEQRLVEIVDNIINNAIKYSPKGEVIKVTVDKDDRMALLTVEDNGPGLTDDDLKKMFQPYGKLSAHPTGNENSTGLGLSIVKQLVEAHDGRVWAESKGKGLGTTFFIAIPNLNII